MRYASLVIACSSLLCTVKPLHAQRRVSFGLGGGVSVPQGERNLIDRVSTGWHVLGTIALMSPTQPLGLRVDVAYNRFPFTKEPPFGEGGHQNIHATTVNVTYRLGGTALRVSPYAIAGVGAYGIASAHPGCELPGGCDGTTRAGWNVGLGANLAMLRVRSFVEVRYHAVKVLNIHVNYIPVTLGLRF
jgi:Outer membrane protein beta-barrel domain